MKEIYYKQLNQITTSNELSADKPCSSKKFEINTNIEIDSDKLKLILQEKDQIIDSHQKKILVLEKELEFVNAKLQAALNSLS